MAIDWIALLTILISQLEKLVAGAMAQYEREQKICQKLMKWPGLLGKIYRFTRDVEAKQMSGDSNVSLWLADLQEIAYDMEDLLEGLATEARKKALGLPGCLSIRRMKAEVSQIDHRLDEIIREMNLLRPSEKFESSNTPAPTSLPERVFFGREREMNDLILRLTGIETDKENRANYTVIPIVGMGGVGKTALAQQLYNHEVVREAFVYRAWACVSNVFDSIAVTKSILETVAPTVSCNGKDLNWLQVTLQDQLSRNKFLIVLDDVWNENHVELDSLLKPFHSGSKESWIILTTRSRKIARRVGHPMMLSFLSADQCMSILACHAIGNENFESRPHLKDVAARLADKCRGLPLAAKTIGGLLHAENTVQKWKDILYQGIWNSDSEANHIRRSLKLSYINLPGELKRCFAACAMFPKDYVFDQEELIRLWIVHGLLPKVESKTYGEVGTDYFHELESRSLFQRASEKKHQYSMHDLINDLAKSVVGDVYFSSDKVINLADEASFGKTRHLSIVMCSWEKFLASKLDVYRAMKKLRTFVPFQISPHYGPNVFVSKKAIHDLIIGFKYLRELSLRFFRITELPDQIGELELLRSLDFSYTLVEVLPDSICDLVNLQFLLLRGCTCLSALPASIHRLTNLHQLDICHTSSLMGMPPRISELTNLEILSKFVVGKEPGQQLKELGSFHHLQKELNICDLHKVERLEDAKIANLLEKHGLSNLSLNWGSGYEIPHYHGHQLKLIELLQPPKEIQQLQVYRYGGQRLPYWCGTRFVNHITSITLFNCQNVGYLPPFGQLPYLKQLYLDGFDTLSKIGAEFYGTGKPFQSLKTLYFENMVAWVEWSSCKGFKKEQPFCCLRELVVKNCPKLNKGLPQSLNSLAVLTISGCPLLTTSEATLSLPFLRNLSLDNSEAGLFGSLVGLTCLTNIVARRVPRFPSLDLRFVNSWVAIEDIEIESCDHIVRLSEDIAGLPSLRNMKIQGCVRLSEFSCTRLPPTLTSLSIVSCHNLRLLPRELTVLPSVLSHLRPVHPNSWKNENCRNCHLIELRLEDCPSLEHYEFYRMRIPHTLKKLQIGHCKGLMSLERLGTEEQHFPSLQELRIRSCENFTKLPDLSSQLSSLTLLSIEDCPALVLDCFPSLPRNLSMFKLCNCPNVQSLPQDMHNLTSLKGLVIWSCTSMACLPQRGFPPYLESLRVGFCEKLKTPLAEWGLKGLKALHALEIGGGMECVDDMVGFPSANKGDWARLLPSSLVYLFINEVESIKWLLDGLCVHLPSLETLQIRKCPKLRYLPKEGLPSSLVSLWILKCEMLKARCSEPKGRYWHFIQHIPDVRFEEELEFKEALPPPDC